MKMNIRNITFFIIIVFLPTIHFSYAATSTGLASLLNEIHSMRASFVQTTYDNHNKPIQNSYGRMALQRPGKFRWEVTKPIPQIIIANQNKLWIYDPDLAQVTVRSLNRTAGEAPALLLSHTDISLEKEFNIRQEANQSKGLTWYTLVPKNTDSSFAKIQLGFSQQQIKEMHLQDNLGHTTRIQFQKIQTNVTLASSLFVFKAGKNVDVINDKH
jgi:outer membrane lipoprotein carrier protein